MANQHPKTAHLKGTQWQPGQSGNPAGKPQGTKHLSTWIRELMEDESFTRKLANGESKREAPVKAVVSTLILKALDGDVKAFDLLAKYGYGTKVDITSMNERFPTPLLSGLSDIRKAMNLADGEQIEELLDTST